MNSSLIVLIAFIIVIGVLLYTETTTAKKYK